MPQYRNGQTVRYKPVGGTVGQNDNPACYQKENMLIYARPPGPESHTSESVGTIKSVLTEPGIQADRQVQASEDQPRYEIENQNTGRLTTIYEKNILGSA
jgi:hypothetical protein